MVLGACQLLNNAWECLKEGCLAWAKTTEESVLMVQQLEEPRSWVWEYFQEAMAPEKVEQTAPLFPISPCSYSASQAWKSKIFYNWQNVLVCLVQPPQKLIQIPRKIDWTFNVQYTLRKQSRVIFFCNACLLLHGSGLFRKRLKYLIVERVWHWEQCMQQILPLCPGGGQPCLRAQ